MVNFGWGTQLTFEDPWLWATPFFASLKLFRSKVRNQHAFDKMYIFLKTGNSISILRQCSHIPQDRYLTKTFSFEICFPYSWVSKVLSNMKRKEVPFGTVLFCFLPFSRVFTPFLLLPHSFRKKKTWSFKLNYRIRSPGPFFWGEFQKTPSADVICCKGTACLWLAADGSRIRSLVALNRVRGRLWKQDTTGGGHLKRDQKENGLPTSNFQGISRWWQLK